MSSLRVSWYHSMVRVSPEETERVEGTGTLLTLQFMEGRERSLIGELLVGGLVAGCWEGGGGDLLGGGADVDVSAVTLEFAVDPEAEDGGVGTDSADKPQENGEGE